MSLAGPHKCQRKSEPANLVVGRAPVITADLVLPSFKHESKNVRVIEPANEVTVRVPEMASSNVGEEFVCSSPSGCAARSLTVPDLNVGVVTPESADWLKDLMGEKKHVLRAPSAVPSCSLFPI